MYVSSPMDKNPSRSFEITDAKLGGDATVCDALIKSL